VALLRHKGAGSADGKMGGFVLFRVQTEFLQINLI
jgi:hypothetical protein